MGCGPYLDSFGPNGVTFPHGSCNTGGYLLWRARDQRCCENGSETDRVGSDTKHMWLCSGGHRANSGAQTQS